MFLRKDESVELSVAVAVWCACVLWLGTGYVSISWLYVVIARGICYYYDSDHHSEAMEQEASAWADRNFVEKGNVDKNLTI